VYKEELLEIEKELKQNKDKSNQDLKDELEKLKNEEDELDKKL
jgi:hypothetical protein